MSTSSLRAILGAGGMDRLQRTRRLSNSHETIWAGGSVQALT